jgi:hypothetical protein
MTYLANSEHSCGIKLSAVLITKNEEKQIAECLESLRFCDEIIVVDSASSDRTVKIAQDFGCRVIQTTDWPGFGLQKQRALDQARGQWVLSIDADERVTPALANEIRKTIVSGTARGYFIKRKSQFLGRWMRFGGWHPDHVLRLAQREFCGFEPALVHEKMLVSGPTSRLKNHFLHYSYRSISDVLEKQKKYALLGASRLKTQRFAQAQASSISLLSAIGHSLWTFFRLYVVQLGALDGRQGLLSAIFKSQETFWKYIAVEFEPSRGDPN